MLLTKEEGASNMGKQRKQENLSGEVKTVSVRKAVSLDKQNVTTKQAISEKQKITTRQLAFTAMFAALVLMATYVFKIPTPTFGYIHVGDGFVLLAGIFLGPGLGALAAGIGSALSDLVGGYAIWVPGTFFIKFLTALIAAVLYRVLKKRVKKTKFAVSIPSVVISGIIGEIVMIFGYFLYNILIISLTNGSFTGAGLASAVTLSVTEIPFNIVQGAVGIVLASLLAPLFAKLQTQAKM